MKQRVIDRLLARAAIVSLISGCCAAVFANTQADAPVPQLTADQIVEKNVAARGGRDAWRKVNTMVCLGHLQSVTSEAGAVPFVLQMKRPDKSRFEVTVDNEKSIRAFDGNQGWKVKPPRGGDAELAPYTAEEVRFAKDAPGIDGPLIDHEAKGIAVTLDGTDEVGGHKAYRLLVKLPSGTTRHVWIDATTFLEIRYDREAHGSGGRAGTVFVYYSDYKDIDGLKIPMTIETKADNGGPGDRMLIDRALLNPPLADSEFAWPGGRHPRSSASGFGAPPSVGQMAPRTPRPGTSSFGAMPPSATAPAPQSAPSEAPATSPAAAQAPTPDSSK